MWDYKLIEVVKGGNGNGRKCEILKFDNVFNKPVYKIRYAGGDRRFWKNSKTNFYHFDSLKTARQKVKNNKKS